MKKARTRVSDHAVLRYLERVQGMDVEQVRREIGHKVDRAVELGASGAVSDGFVYRIESGVVVTITRHCQPERGQRRRGTS